MIQRCGLPFTFSLLHPKNWSAWFGLGLAAIISVFPTSARHSIGRKVGTYIYNNNKKRRHTVNTNLSITFPDLPEDQREAMSLRHLQWYGCGLVDYSMVFFASKKRLALMSEIIGKEHIDAAMTENKTVILLLAHSVMLEFGPPQIGYHFDIFGSYKTSKNPVLDWIVAHSRCRHASLVVSREEGLRKLVKSMSPERVMIFLPDEDLGRENSVFAPFFGKQKSTLTTTARLAKMGKAVALPLYVYFDESKQKYITHIGAPLENYPSKDAVADCTNMNHSLETLISQKPEQYMWFMKWYYTRPEGEPEVY
ncbi:MAG: lauroyl/myristoyl acyltransferase [Cocleimonas sp.]|jgi:lauroyl/myristoyl acyltransferase